MRATRLGWSAGSINNSVTCPTKWPSRSYASPPKRSVACSMCASFLSDFGARSDRWKAPKASHVSDIYAGRASAPQVLLNLFNWPVTAGALRIATRNQDGPAAGEGKNRVYPRLLLITLKEWRTGGSASLHHAFSEHPAADELPPGKGSNFSDSRIRTKKLHLSR